MKKGIINDYCFVEDLKQEVLNHFNLKEQDFGKGYIYSIAELTGIYVCKTPYLLHYSSDSYLKYPSDWIQASISLLESNNNIKVINPKWQSKHSLKKQIIAEDTDFYYSIGFSDQSFLVSCTVDSLFEI